MLLDLAEARGAVAGLDADPVGLLQRLAAGTILIGMRAVLASPFCFVGHVELSFQLREPAVAGDACASRSPRTPRSRNCVTAMPA